ncbi:hypothetical protein BBJ41_37800 [Burkholderia stabilis]|uniref:hypothetical protein n=1 Tax=Burkholderia stabilis TaxID=95485 RepID=UPI000851FE6C|nr:hypothetical protein [Burkholderia stabilis]AOR73281.1 hypothetical protein BBJ41_37800 [Burkholderia stabilis]HDR9494333.1 hypothetical protein [Burkholderia stabilis]HDR9541301.1 hypothetical protein [Burkholderia stabilis]HDR9570905.1 hypothetical protein [Burkholderia stabilis]HDR9579183.1 hypothetical protein [Burkholderia stabilis]
MIPSAINKANSDASDKSATRDEYDALRKHGSDDVPTGKRIGTLTGKFLCNLPQHDRMFATGRHELQT